MATVLGVSEAPLRELFEELRAWPVESANPPPSGSAALGYRRVSLRKDERSELVAAYWTAGDESALHGHGDAAAVYVVRSGTVEHERYLPDGKGGYHYESVVLRAGDISVLPVGTYHRVLALTDAVTLHAYAPSPTNPNATVSPETRGLLLKARALGSAHPGIHTASELLDRIDAHLDSWAEREAAAVDSGSTRLPTATLNDLRNSSLLAAPIPQRLGGWGVDLSLAVEAIRRVARRAPSTALALAMPWGNAATCRIPADVLSPELRPALRDGQQWIADRVSEGRILAVANSEPGAGGELSQTRTTAQRDHAGVYRLSGRKAFATFGPDADYFLCAARRPGFDRDVIDGFFVARSAPGLCLDSCWDPAGMRPTASVGMLLTDAPAEMVMGYPGCLEGVNARHWSTVLFAAVFLGVGEAALQEGVNAASASNSVWAQGQLAETALELEGAAGLIEAVAASETWPMPSPLVERTRRAKTFAARAAVKAATQAVVLAGGRSYRQDHPVYRLLNDALAGPLVRPPLANAMDAIIKQLFAKRK